MGLAAAYRDEAARLDVLDRKTARFASPEFAAEIATIIEKAERLGHHDLAEQLRVRLRNLPRATRRARQRVHIMRRQHRRPAFAPRARCAVRTRPRTSASVQAGRRRRAPRPGAGDDDSPGEPDPVSAPLALAYSAVGR